jgi:AraC-like DNA-binding protein
MDLLTDILHQAGLRRRLLDLRCLDAATPLRFPCGRSIGLHVVRQGRVYLHAPTLDAPLLLEAGDIAVMGRGCDHVLSATPAFRPQAVVPIRTAWSSPAEPASPVPADASTTAVISGAYQLWNEPVHPFLRQLPAWHVLRAERIPRLGPLALATGLLDQEARASHLGAETLVHALLDVIFTYVLRELVEHLGAGGASWSRAVHDPQVSQALASMHADCAHPWTLESLAADAGLSRTGFAERFRVTMGDTPLNYLRAVRIQKSIGLLSETGRTLEQVARAVGYQDAFSFSKVFKRTTGLSPREFRRADAQAQDSAWRFRAG